jgi:hypothetical protein
MTRQHHRLITALEDDIDRHNIDALIAHVKHAVALDAVTGHRQDGWPSMASGNGAGGGGGGRRMTVTDEHGQPDEIPTTSTEAAALANVEQQRQPDPVHNIARSSVRALQQIADALNRLEGDKVRLEALRSTKDVADSPQCYIASVVHQLPWDEAWTPFRATDFDTYLPHKFDEPRKVCRWTYEFVRRWRRLPSEDEMRQYLAVGVVRLHEVTNRR